MAALIARAVAALNAASAADIGIASIALDQVLTRFVGRKCFELVKVIAAQGQVANMTCARVQQAERLVAMCTAAVRVFVVEIKSVGAAKERMAQNVRRTPHGRTGRALVRAAIAQTLATTFARSVGALLLAQLGHAYTTILLASSGFALAVVTHLLQRVKTISIAQSVRSKICFVFAQIMIDKQ